MACNSDFVQYIIDQCSGAGEIAVKKMMGDYCVYCDGVLFGLICDNNFYVKVTEPGKAALKEVILRPPYDGAKDYFYISDVFVHLLFKLFIKRLVCNNFDYFAKQWGCTRPLDDKPYL